MITYEYEKSPEQIRQALDYFRHQFFDRLPSRCWIAGGAVRDWFATGVVRKDVDVFTPDDDAMADVRRLIEQGPLKGKVIYETSTVTGYATEAGKIEIVKMHFPTPEATIEQFDFTVVCAVVDAERRLVVHDTFFIDLSGRRLVINALPFPFSTLERMQKMIKLGYTACNGTLLRMIEGVRAVDLRDPQMNQLEFYRDGSPRFRRID